MRTDLSYPPSDLSQQAVRSTRVFSSHDVAIYFALSCLRIGTLAWFLWHWFSPGIWYSEPLAFAAITILIAIAVAGNQLRWAALPFMQKPEPLEVPAGLRVAAATTYVPGFESPEMLERTLRALVSLDYPHDTWLLDEGGSDEMRAVCESLSVRYFSRRWLPQYNAGEGPFAARTKHGNYNAWLHEAGYGNYDILIAFDPDHVPLPHYAKSVLGYFRDPQIAYVQAPQVYRNQSASLVARGAAEETYAYYSVTEMASYGGGQPVLTGCHNAHRLSVLEQLGGFPDHTAEDLLLTEKYRRAGWKGVYVPDVLATGLAPEGWPEYLTQQLRWARSVLDVKLRRLSAHGKASPIGLLQGFGYLQDALFAGLFFLCLTAMLLTGAGQNSLRHCFAPTLAALVVVLFASDFFRQRFFLQPRIEAGIHWRAAILRLAKWPLVWKALWLVSRDKPFAYTVTPKTKSTRSAQPQLLVHAVIAAIIGLAWLLGLGLGHVHGRQLNTITAFALALSLGVALVDTPRTAVAIMQRKSKRERLLDLIPLVIALAFAGLSLRGFTHSSIAGYDTARHVMNGAFLLDLFRNGRLLHPVQFGFWYYSRLPALSLPYHPPLFPSVEALFYSVFGVSHLSARLAEAFATGVAALLLIRLIRKSHSSLLLAVMVTTSFFLLPRVQEVYNIVMLEMPALAFVSASLLFLLPEQEMFRSARSLWFGVFAAAAIWTKQTVFLAALPFIYVAVAARPVLLRRMYFWASVGITASAALALALLARQLHWTGINQSWAKRNTLELLAHNWHFYLTHTGPILALVALCLLTYLLPEGKSDFCKDRLYIAWILAVALVLLVVPVYSTRYALFAVPAILVVLYNSLHRLGKRVLAKNQWALSAAVFVAVVAYGLLHLQVAYLDGPADVARALHASGHHRILYCGVNNGPFIFGIRSADPSLSTLVIRGDKLPASTFSPAQLQAFILRYGIDSVVFERRALPSPWDALSPQGVPFLLLDRVVPMPASDPEVAGSLLVYAVPNPTTPSEADLTVPISVLGRDIDLHF